MFEEYVDFYFSCDESLIYSFYCYEWLKNEIRIENLFCRYLRNILFPTYCANVNAYQFCDENFGELSVIFPDIITGKGEASHLQTDATVFNQTEGPTGLPRDIFSYS